jgi:hypothetical protein
VASFLQKIGNTAYNVTGAGNVMKGVRGIRKNGLDLGDVGNIALGLSQGALLAIPGGGGALAAGKVAAAAAKTAGAGRVARQIPRVVATTKGLNPKTYALTFGKNIKTGLTTTKGLANTAGRVGVGVGTVAGITEGLNRLNPPQKIINVKKPPAKEPSLISIQPNNPNLNKPPAKSVPPAQLPATQPPAKMGFLPLPGNIATSTPPNRALIDDAINTQTPSSNVTSSTGKSITPQPPRTDGTGSKIDPNTNTLKNTSTPNTSTNISKPTTQNVTPVIDSNTGELTYQTETPKTQTQDNNWYPHYGTDGRFLGYYRYPQQATTQQAPVRDLAREEAEIKAAQQAQINEIYNQRLAREKEQEMLRQQQQRDAELNAARQNEYRQQLSIIDSRNTGVPPWMLAAKQRYEAGLGRSQALGAVREQDIRDLLSQRQMAARGRAAGMVGGRSTGILGSSLTGARRGYDLNIRNETLRRIEEQAALKERYDEYLSEAARQASLRQLEDAQERAKIVEQIRSLGGSI